MFCTLLTYSGKSSIYCPPKFDGLNFPIWKVKMTIFLNLFDSRVAKAISKPFVYPGGESELPLRNTMPSLKFIMHCYNL